jgi:hypothetical protein
MPECTALGAKYRRTQPPGNSAAGR